MHIKSFNSHYNLIEFNFYITTINDKCSCVLELLIDCLIDNFDEQSFDKTLIIETDEQIYVFSNYEVNEYYSDGSYTRVVCVK